MCRRRKRRLLEREIVWCRILDVPYEVAECVTFSQLAPFSRFSLFSDIRATRLTSVPIFGDRAERAGKAEDAFIPSFVFFLPPPPKPTTKSVRG